MSGSFIARSGSVTLPAGTPTYASGDLVANHATAGSVVPITLADIVRAEGAGFRCDCVRLRKSGTGITNASFRVLIFDRSPTVSVGDDAALLSGSTYAVSDIAHLLATYDVTMDRVGTAGATGPAATPAAGVRTLVPNSGLSLFALIMALGAYQRVANEVFTVTLEGARG